MSDELGLDLSLSWGKLLDRWHDEGRIFHALRGDGSPACGVPYWSSTGPYPGDIPEQGKCKRCKRIVKP